MEKRRRGSALGQRVRSHHSLNPLDTVLWHCNKKIWKNSPFALGGYKDRNLTEWLQPLLVTQSDQICPHCQRVLILRTSYDVEPEFLLFEVKDVKAEVESEVKVPRIRYSLSPLRIGISW